MEFLKLSHAIPPSYYDAVGISLGIPLAQLQAILIQMSNNYSNAFLRVFMKWNVKQQVPLSNKRQLLADALREIDLGGLSDRILNEPLIPNSTGKHILILPTPEDIDNHSSKLVFTIVFYTFATIYRNVKFRSDPMHVCITKVR